jgi:hypothetical protein
MKFKKKSFIGVQRIHLKADNWTTLVPTLFHNQPPFIQFWFLLVLDMGPDSDSKTKPEPKLE